MTDTNALMVGDVFKRFIDFIVLTAQADIEPSLDKCPVCVRARLNSAVPKKVPRA